MPVEVEIVYFVNRKASMGLVEMRRVRFEHPKACTGLVEGRFASFNTVKRVGVLEK